MIIIIPGPWRSNAAVLSRNCIESVLQKLMASSPSAKAEAEGRGKRKRKEMEMGISKVHREELWPNAAVHALLGKFEYLCFNEPQPQAHAQGYLGKTQWGRIAAAVNAVCGATYTPRQCKYKWNRLKKSYNKAKLRREPSGFGFYHHVERIVERVSVSGRERQHPPQIVAAEDDDDDVESICSAASDESEQEKIEMRDRYPERRGVLLKTLGHKMERGMAPVAHAVENIEKTRTEEIKKLLDAQLQISTVLVQGKKELKQSGLTGNSAQKIRRTGLAC